METKIMQSTEKGINLEMERGRKATIKIAQLMDKCEKNWQETDDYPNARKFIIDRFNLSPATVSNYIGCVNMFDLNNNDSEWLKWNMGQLTELLRLKDVNLAIDLVERGCIDISTPAVEIREYVKDTLLCLKDDRDEPEEVEDDISEQESDISELESDISELDDESKINSITNICRKYKVSENDINFILRLTGLLPTI